MPASLTIHCANPRRALPVISGPSDPHPALVPKQRRGPSVGRADAAFVDVLTRQQPKASRRCYGGVRSKLSMIMVGFEPVLTLKNEDGREQVVKP